MRIRPTIPTCESTLCLFAAHLGEKGLQHQTIKSYMSAVRFLQISRGFQDPNIPSMDRLAYVLKGIKRSRGPSQPLPRLPITPAILETLFQAWRRDLHEHDAAMLIAACSCGFFGFLRSGEFTIQSPSSFDPSTHLTLQDVALDDRASPSMICLHLKQSKTDPFRQGTDIYMGKTDKELCPVRAAVHYLRLRGDRSGFLFLFRDGSPLTKPVLVQQIRDTLDKQGIDGSKYAGHSFHIGAASTVASKGLEDSTIKALGRWRSSAYHRYIKPAPAEIAKHSRTLV